MAANEFLKFNTGPDQLPANTGTPGVGMFNAIKLFLSNVVGAVLTVLIVLATVAAPQIMIPALALYGIYKFFDTATGNGQATPELKNAFYVWLFWIVLALLTYLWAKRKKLI